MGLGGGGGYNYFKEKMNMSNSSKFFKLTKMKLKIINATDSSCLFSLKQIYTSFVILLEYEILMNM